MKQIAQYRFSQEELIVYSSKRYCVVTADVSCISKTCLSRKGDCNFNYVIVPLFNFIGKVKE